MDCRHGLPSRTSSIRPYVRPPRTKTSRDLLKFIYRCPNDVQIIFHKYSCVVCQGSGKTFTIGGGNIATQTEEEFGVIPRAVKQIFDTIQVRNCIILCVS